MDLPHLNLDHYMFAPKQFLKLCFPPAFLLSPAFCSLTTGERFCKELPSAIAVSHSGFLKLSVTLPHFDSQASTEKITKPRAFLSSFPHNTGREGDMA